MKNRLYEAFRKLHTKHVVMFSGGAGSWAAAKRVMAQRGRRNVILLFADTLVEDPDLYRFLEDAEKNLGGADHSDRRWPDPLASFRGRALYRKQPS